MSNTETKRLALIAYLGLHPNDPDITSLGCNQYDDGCGAEYLVYTDEEADAAWDEALDSYIDECIMCEIKDRQLKRYFDRDAWKHDAKIDGRGHALSGYDGDEHEYKFEGVYYYIYRVN